MESNNQRVWLQYAIGVRRLYAFGGANIYSRDIRGVRIRIRFVFEALR